MKSTSTILLSALALGVSSIISLAEDAPKPGGQGGAGGPGGPGGRPVPPIIAALDANKDGVIDAQEIANASAALKTLDKDGDGKLSGDEIHLPHGDRGPGGPGGKGPRDGDGKGKGGAPDGAKGGKGGAPDGAPKDKAAK